MLPATAIGKITAVAPNPEAEGLNDTEKAIIEALFRGATSLADAAKKAGCSEGYARKAGSVTWRKPEAQGYFLALLSTDSIVMGAGALHVLNALMHGSESDHVRLGAARDVLDRLGLRAPQRHQHQHDVNVSVEVDLGD